MALKLPQPTSQWNQPYQVRVNQALETNDLTNRKKGADVELLSERLILHSPNGTGWEITVSDSGMVGVPGGSSLTVAGLPAASGYKGTTLWVSDGAASLAWGAVPTGGGSTPYLVWSNGTAWTVIGK